MGIDGLVAGAAVGLVGGFTSGLLGVSPGGGLVVFSVLLLGAEQHVAQGVSLAAQIPPTSLAGIQRYRKGGVRTPARWFAPLAIGFLVGGVGGAGAPAWSLRQRCNGPMSRISSALMPCCCAATRTA